MADAGATEEAEPEKIPDSKYDVAMAVIDADTADDGEGMAIDYVDYQDRMTKTEFDAFFDKVTRVTKMLKLLSVYRPALFETLKDMADPDMADPDMADPESAAAPGTDKKTAVEPFQQYLTKF